MNWKSFLSSAENADIDLGFQNGIELAVDCDPSHQGISLNKKSEYNVLGERRPSVLQLTQDSKFPLSEPTLSDFGSFNGFLEHVCLKVEDASPDSVLSVLVFAARQSEISIPPEVWDSWLPAINEWERTGIVDAPEKSWPALAAALAHSVLGSSSLEASLRGETDATSLVRAWKRVVPFAIEALQAGYDPRDVPTREQGPHLALARAALDEEKARYERKLYAQQVHQLSLPMIGSERPRLVDALFTEEQEFTGALKVFARNDRVNSPLGRGFTVLVLTRPAQRDLKPQYWVTISLDTRIGVHLEDLWRELERLETEAWVAAGRSRPKILEDQSRWLDSVDSTAQKYHQQWYLDPQRSLIGSPKRQVPPGTLDDGSVPGSLLTVEQIQSAIFKIFDPLRHSRVSRNKGADTESVADLPAEVLAGKKRVLSAWWPNDNPLPHPSGPSNHAGLFPTALRAMAALTLGTPASSVIASAPDLEEISLVSFGNGLAIITDGGVFLLDSGRSRPALIKRATELVERQAELAAELDAMQAKVERRALLQANELKKRGSTRSWLEHQRFCANLHARLIRLRGSLDKPLETDAASLRQLKERLSEQWNVRDRIGELAAEIEWLQQNGRAAEELRMFRAGRWAAGFALAIVVPDALAGRVAPFAQPALWNGATIESAEIVSFGAIFLLTVVSLISGAASLRGSAAASESDLLEVRSKSTRTA